MFIFIITLIIIAALLLVLVVLAQNPKGGGLSSQFGGGGSTTQLMGVKRTGDLLEKLTWGLSITIMVLSLAGHIFMNQNSPSTISSPILEKAEQETILPPASSTTPIQGADSTNGNPLE